MAAACGSHRDTSPVAALDNSTYTVRRCHDVTPWLGAHIVDPSLDERILRINNELLVKILFKAMQNDEDRQVSQENTV